MEQLTGNEEFILEGAYTGVTINDYWRWAYSDLLNNTYRGVMAEFLVFSSLYPTTIKEQVRSDWLPCDIISPSGRRIEVKSAAYLQSWTDDDLPSKIQYDIAPKCAWDGKVYASEAKRNCDLYIFCLYTALTRDKPILDLDNWEFYVLAASVLNEKAPTQKTISLSSLIKLDPTKTSYANLSKIIESIKV
ncbi:MAG: hypothetical protein HDR24_13985 [Lachnospiraceae bacterium]|nr:hypothetical protein [Lachnospiraceae bacterium]